MHTLNYCLDIIPALVYFTIPGTYPKLFPGRWALGPRPNPIEVGFYFILPGVDPKLLRGRWDDSQKDWKMIRVWGLGFMKKIRVWGLALMWLQLLWCFRAVTFWQFPTCRPLLKEGWAQPSGEGWVESLRSLFSIFLAFLHRFRCKNAPIFVQKWSGNCF